ncbi:hypothetical protein R1flu_007711 [Riccia fluitans]|uniref:Uncharacterized protein n=1 Tax=Riccia fluitans TaxID=41844 RepID=A0ABD1Z3T7_9MARC
MELFIQHLCRHENLVYRQNNVPQAAIDFLETHVNSQLRRVDLYNMLCKEGLIDPSFIHKAQVNFWIFELLGKVYVRDVNNQLHSVKLVLEESGMRSKDLEVVLYEDTEYLATIAFVTPFWCKVEAVHEIVIDSTFKTNALRFELFAMSANIGGVGMPLSYLLFNKRKDESEVEEVIL